MSRSLMGAVEESLDPRTVSNALYELMLDWKSSVDQWNMHEGESNKSKTQRKNANKKREWIEVTLGRFLNKEHTEMRALLEKHYNVKVGKR